MEKKFTVFISSTYKDLAKEREAVAMAILNMQHIPVGMEQFTAADELSWEVIQGQLELSDYFVLIVAHRYGSMLGDTGFVELEYNYAVEHGIPILAFFVEKSVPWSPEFQESNPSAKKKLEAFKRRVLADRQVAEWRNKDELAATFVQAFSKQRARKDRPGWVRGSDVAGPEAVNEIARLSRENSELRERLKTQDVRHVEFEVVWASLREEEVHERKSGLMGRLEVNKRTRWGFDAVVLVSPTGIPALSVPKHCTKLQLAAGHIIHPIEEFFFSSKDALVSVTSIHALFTGPGAFRISSKLRAIPALFSPKTQIDLHASFRPRGIDQEYSIRASLLSEQSEKAAKLHWSYRNNGYTALDAEAERESSVP